MDQIVTSLKDNGSVTRGYIGVQMQAVTKEIAEAIGAPLIGWLGEHVGPATVAAGVVFSPVLAGVAAVLEELEARAGGA